ncbi:MAG: hypothetical protein WC052_04755 [Patescibacteria group bacterium]|jgi:hypothetical protein
MQTLFISPYVGETGWELMCWQGFIRKLAKQYDYVTVACRTGHELLYCDYADHIIHYDPHVENTDMWKNYGEEYGVSLFLASLPYHNNQTIIHNDVYQTRWWNHERWDVQQELIPFNRFGGDVPAYDVLLIVRDTNKCNTGFRNWPVSHATEFTQRLRSRGFTVACVGKRGSAAAIPGTADLRDLPLYKLAQIMDHARVIVGPQSGPIHFATLCKLPQVCWQTCPEHAVRTVQHWNPFNTKVYTMPSDAKYWRERIMWLPLIEDLMYATNTLLRGGLV